MGCLPVIGIVFALFLIIGFAGSGGDNETKKTADVPQESNDFLQPKEGAFQVGDIVEAKGLTITYLSCEDYTSDNFVSTYDFDCYADGTNCKQTYIREDDLNATISAGRKVNGLVC